MSACQSCPAPTHSQSFPTPASVTSYPACARRGAELVGPTPGHIVSMPPNVRTKPPNQTHQTRGLMLKRYTASSVPSTDPRSKARR